MFENIVSCDKDKYRTIARLFADEVVYNVSFFKYEGKDTPAVYASSMETYTEQALMYSVIYENSNGRHGGL